MYIKTGWLIGGTFDMESKGIKVSIVMPVYNVKRYLKQCLESLLSQTLKDIEIIAVNDGSTDNSLEILEEYQSKYPDMIRVYSTENRGVSHARNYGLARAKGDYILFVDSDDYIEKEMCEKLYTKAITDNNDLVICGRYNVFEREHVGQRKREIVKTGLLNRNFVLSENKFELAHILPFPWDKLYKRSLLEGMAFPEGMRFEDLALIYQVVCKAEYIGVVEEPLYNYRKTTQGGFLNSFSKQTLDIIKAFEIVFDFMKKNNYMDLYYDELEFICARHFLYRYISLFKKENKGKGKLDIKLEIINKTQDFLDKELPNWRNNHYLKYSSGWLKKHLPLFTNRRKMVFLTKLREYMPDRVYRILNKARNYKSKAINKIHKFRKSNNKKALINKKLPIISILRQGGSVYYTALYEKLPVEDKSILLESKHGEDVAGNIFALLQELSKPEYGHYRVKLALQEELFPRYKKLLERYNIKNITYIKMNSKEYMKALATAKYLVTDTSFPTYFIKKDEQVYLNTWHGTPLKAMGRIVPGREYAQGNVQRNFLIADYLLYQNHFSKEVFQRDYMIDKIHPGTTLVSGYPRNSVFFKEERYVEIRKELGLTNKQVIVYMPTWRGLLHKKETDKQLEKLSLYFNEIDQRLSASQIFYVKLHPYVKEHMDYSNYKNIKEFPHEYETYDFLSASDILVTDYSSIMFDYGVTKRKIILFTYDREEYLADRGLYLDLDSLELPKVNKVDELMDEINRDKFEYPNFHKTFCSYDSVNTPKQVLEILLNGSSQDMSNLDLIKASPSDKKRLLVFTKGLKHDDQSNKIIKMINSIDNDKYDVFVAMKAEDVKRATELLSELKSQVGYFPLNYEINYTRMDYILSKLCLRLGLHSGYLTKRIDQIMLREKKKYFGDVIFDYCIHHSCLDRLVSHICCMLGKKTVYNFKNFNYDKYKHNREYNKQIKYFAKRFQEYDVVVATKEWEALGVRADNVYINEEIRFPIQKVLNKLDEE